MAHNTATLAKGCFGKVYKEKYNDTWAAIKRVPQHLIKQKDLERECEIYNSVKHPNIVKLLGKTMLKDGKWVIPLEFIFGEDLETTIFKVSQSKIPLNPSAKSTIIVGMCEGLLHLHLKDVVHQDLKPENIMVEHNTNRAVIIDMGLAKFFKNGLSSAIDMGNEAYSAPEVLQRGIQRDQRSDVWAMGKIIAELCARVRLVTPSVCPEKIKEKLGDSPYCHAVCRMVEPNPTQRASMAGVISEIRRVGGPSSAPTTAVTGGHLKLPPNPVTARNRSPSPMDRAGTPLNIAHSPYRAPSPLNNERTAINRSPSPRNWERTPRPDVKELRPPAQQHISPSPPKTENKNQALIPKGAANLTPDFMQMKFYQEVANEMQCNLPETGRVMMRGFEESEDGVRTWHQKEVIMRDGKMVKYDDVKFNSK